MCSYFTTLFTKHFLSKQNNASTRLRPRGTDPRLSDSEVWGMVTLQNTFIVRSALTSLQPHTTDCPSVHTKNGPKLGPFCRDYYSWMTILEGSVLVSNS